MTPLPRFFRRALILLFLVVSGSSAQRGAQNIIFRPIEKDEFIPLTNRYISFTVKVEGKKLAGEMLIGTSEWCAMNGTAPRQWNSDGNFRAEVMWTDWQAPGKTNNADNPVTLTAADFSVRGYALETTNDGTRRLTLLLKQSDGPIHCAIDYQLGAGAFYVRKRIAFTDSTSSGHYLQEIAPVDCLLAEGGEKVNAGGFGQPVAIRSKESGIFFGFEYPAATNGCSAAGRALRIVCRQERGEIIPRESVTSDWCVVGLSPNALVKRWFMRYLDDIRVAPLRPYTLYNSWYDLRSTEYPRVPAENKMNQENILRIVDLMKKNMVEKHDIRLDAFVLDDGWDVYESDWKLRGAEFPNGLKPIVETLRGMNCSLGIWLGPTGGYSFHAKRLSWMRDHGYETVGATPNNSMLCLAGEKYSALFAKRTGDFVRDDGVGYFKWDGIQFSCSESGHGHPVGIYSRRAVMQSVIDKCRNVRALNPNVFLNITSGTWLSPWWVQYANQIWMQGEDYGYADVPSISPRDAAITYRDFVLYDDFRNNNFWFPIANLMTHGIIKGRLEMLGGEQEPLDKFTNEVVLYLARGVSMWELYISPDIMSEGEWNAMGQAMRWARDRFRILANTEMIGGDPRKRETYGYVHFNGTHGIVAARNPWIAGGSLRFELTPAAGIDPTAADLVVEKVYPSRWVAPKLYRAGESFTIPLDGYETAVYEIYPLSEAKEPLPAGVEFAGIANADGTRSLRIYSSAAAPRFLNFDLIKQDSVRKGSGRSVTERPPVDLRSLSCRAAAEPGKMDAKFRVDTSVSSATLGILLTRDGDQKKSKPPVVHVRFGDLDLEAKPVEGEGASIWYTVPLGPGSFSGTITVTTKDPAAVWSGRAALWLTTIQKRLPTEWNLALKNPPAERPLPPLPFEDGTRLSNTQIGECALRTAR